MKKLFLFISILLFFGIMSSFANAASKKSNTALINVSTKYIKNRKTVQVNFGNLKDVKKVSYTLFYEGNGIGQGVTGSISVGKQKTVTRNMVLGTCSSGVCMYHKNVKNIKLEVKTIYRSGKSSVKKYTIKN